MIMVDSNVMLDVVTADPQWSDWSLSHLETAVANGPVLADPIVYAELAVRFDRIEALEEVASDIGLIVASPPREALFAAGQAFRAYRARGGPRNAILPDLLIGAHAAVLDVPLLTRDPRRFRSYFPKLTLLSP